jgi:hypothetical protein
LIEDALADTLHGPALGFGPTRGGFIKAHAVADQMVIEQLFVYGAPSGGLAFMWAMNRAVTEDTANASQYRLYQYFGDPAAPVKGMIVTSTQTAGVDDQNQAGHIWLSPSCPNPVRRSSLIQYDLPVGGQISLTLYDIQGRALAKLVDGWQAAGRYNIQFAPATMQLSPGMYLVQLRVGNETRTRRVIVLQ